MMSDGISIMRSDGGERDDETEGCDTVTCNKIYNITTNYKGDTTHLLVCSLVVVHPSDNPITPLDWPSIVTGNLILYKAVLCPTPYYIQLMASTSHDSR